MINHSRAAHLSIRILSGRPGFLPPLNVRPANVEGSPDPQGRGKILGGYVHLSPRVNKFQPNFAGFRLPFVPGSPNLYRVRFKNKIWQKAGLNRPAGIGRKKPVFFEKIALIAGKLLTPGLMQKAAVFWIRSSPVRIGGKDEKP